MYIYLCICVQEYLCRNMLVVRGQLWRTVLSFHCAGSRGGTQALWLGSKHLDPLNQLTSSKQHDLTSLLSQHAEPTPRAKENS